MLNLPFYIVWICTCCLPYFLALHTERVQASLIGATLDPVDVLDHRRLEEDLSTQLSLLAHQQQVGGDLSTKQRNKDQEEIHDKNLNIAADVQHLIEEGEQIFLAPTGIGEGIAMIVALLFIVAMPYLANFE